MKKRRGKSKERGDRSGVRERRRHSGESKATTRKEIRQYTLHYTNID